MSEKQTIRALESTARWCRETYKGILTEKGNPKKPPTFWIVRCPRCGLGLTSSKEVTYKSIREGTAECKRLVSVPVKSKGTSASYLASVRCKRRVEPVRKTGEEK